MPTSRVAALAAVLAVVLVAACSAGSPVAVPTPISTPTPSLTPSSSPKPPPPPTPGWVVGAHPLALRPDGFGQVLATPAVLRNRRLPTKDTLPPPTDGRFHSTLGPITQALRSRMGSTYKPGCPMPVSSLRYLTVSFHGFDGRAHTGEIVMATSAAPKVTRAFARLWALEFPLEQMILPTDSDVTGPPTGDGDDTAGFVCRSARGQTRFSAHAYGLALDINPFQNPYVKRDLVLPELASAYVDRRWHRPGMLLPGSAAVRAFTQEGFTWGGAFRSLKDYQHLSLTGD